MKIIICTKHMAMFLCDFKDMTLNPDIGKQVFSCSPHLCGLWLINYRAI